MKKRKSKVFKIVIAIILCFVIGVGGFALIKTLTGENGNSGLFSVSTFYLTVDGKNITDSDSGYVLTSGEPLEVDVVFPFERVNPASKGYSVKIIPSGKVNFEFLVGTTVHTFLSESDFTSMFEINKNDDSFTVGSNKTFEELFSDRYPSETVYIDLTTLTSSYADMFRIVVSSDDGTVITIDFSFGFSVESISLSREEIVF